MICLFMILINQISTAQPWNYGKNKYNISVDGKEREFYVHIPKSYKEGIKIPLVFMLHGTGGDGEKFYEESGWAELSEKEDFIAVFPSSLRYRIIDHEGEKTTTKWNTSSEGEFSFQPGEVGYDDIKFLRRVIELIVSGLSIETKRIYLNGFSNGGGMASKCSIELSDLLAAVCSNAGSFQKDTVYIPKRKIPYLYQVGNKDYGPGNVGPEFPEIPMIFFDTVISTPNLPIREGRLYNIANNAIRHFSLQSNHAAIVGDTNFAVFTTYYPIDSKDKHEFKYVFVKGLGHSYPNWAPKEHWEWMKKYDLDINTSSVNNLVKDEPIRIFPNPSNDHIQINLDNQYNVFNAQGIRIYSGAESTLDISTWLKGMYIIRSKGLTGKFIKL